MKIIPSNIIISRTDSIGDMVLTLPLAKILKAHFKNIKVFFLGKEYTRNIVQACRYSDGFIEMNDFLNNMLYIDGQPYDAIIHVKPERNIANRAKELNIRWRIGTTNRLYHWTTCNKLIPLSRRHSSLHEAQLNLKLLQPFGINKNFSHSEISTAYGLANLKPLKKEFALLIDQNKYNIILHPKSRGNAREWSLENYINLVRLLDVRHYKIFLSGVEGEQSTSQLILDKVGDLVTNIQGKMPLDQFTGFIAACDGLVACSTGPLHIAAATGIDAYGIYAPVKPLDAGRWGPIGKNAQAFFLQKDCMDCKNNLRPCTCINSISPEIIFKMIEKQAALKFKSLLKQSLVNYNTAKCKS